MWHTLTSFRISYHNTWHCNYRHTKQPNVSRQDATSRDCDTTSVDRTLRHVVVTLRQSTGRYVTWLWHYVSRHDATSRGSDTTSVDRTLRRVTVTLRQPLGRYVTWLWHYVGRHDVTSRGCDTTTAARTLSGTGSTKLAKSVQMYIG